MKKIMTLVFLVFAISIFLLSMFFAQLDISKSLTSPHLSESYYSESFIVIEEDDNVNVPNLICNIADEANVNLMVGMNASKKNTFQYYWFLSDAEPLNNLNGLNISISLEEFNSLSYGISNNSNSFFYFDYLLDNYTYELYPFHKISTEDALPDIKVYSPSLDNIDAFFNIAKNSNIDLLKIDNDIHSQGYSFVSLLPMIFFNNPLTIVIISLYIIVLFLYIFEEQKNMKIKIIFGYTQITLILEYTRKLVKEYLLINLIGLLLIGGLKFKFDMYRLSYVLKYYVIFGAIGIMILLLIVSGSIMLSGNRNISSGYIRRKQKNKTGWILKPLKFVLTILLTLSLHGSILATLDSYDNYQTIKGYTSKYQDIMVMQASGNYTRTVFEKSDVIYDLIKDHPSVFYMQAFNENPTVEDLNLIENHIILANLNYINHQKLIDKELKATEDDFVMTQSKNDKAVQDLKVKTSLVCKDKMNCSDIEVIEIDDNSKINLLTMNPSAHLFELENDFVIVPYTEYPQVFSLFFYINSQEIEDELRSLLSQGINTQEISFTPLHEIWESDLNQQKNTLMSDLFKATVSMLLISFITSVVFYVSYKNNEKYYTIQWVHGISPNEMWRLNLVSETLTTLIAMVLSIKIFNLSTNTLVVMTISLFLVLVNLFALTLFSRYFYKHAVIVIKER
ncbi:MAG: hypothetical protein RR565_07665 [Erysipelothrix sp.]